MTWEMYLIVAPYLGIFKSQDFLFFLPFKRFLLIFIYLFLVVLGFHCYKGFPLVAVY